MSIRNNHIILFGSVLFLSLFVVRQVFAQSTYTMQNATVTDCEGILTDSEDGEQEGQYAHNEDYIFTICVDNAEEIVVNFDFFATEENYDVLTVYDGPDTNAPVLATLTGIIQPPPVLVAESGCITFHFVSDDNIVAKGWSLNWSVEVEEPEPPELSLANPPECPMSSAVFQFDREVDCSVFDPANFTVVGPGGSSVSDVIPLDCDSTGMGQEFEVVFDPPLDQPGSFRLLFDGSIRDVCGQWHEVSNNVLFELSNCPFEVDIELVNDACQGDCGNVTATVTGTAATSFNFDWSHTGLNQQEVPVCADDTFQISVTVTDPASGETADDTFTYIPLEIPEILNPIQDTVCASSGDHFYDASIPGGNYYSDFIPGWAQNAGRFQFWRHSTGTGLRAVPVTYVAPNGCEAYDTVHVLPVWTGGREAACLNSGDFDLDGGVPDGGSWSGDHVSPDGVFSPVESGSFVLTYTAPNGCPDWKRVNVADSITMPDVDTVCSSNQIDLEADPYGGEWSGPGIVNATRGRLRPWLVDPNQTYTYVYEATGCTDTMDIYIQELWAGPDHSVCTADSIFYLEEEGDWSGPAPYIPDTNAFDISGLDVGQYDFTLSRNGCTDDFRLYVIDPNVEVNNNPYFCPRDEWHNLADYIDFAPDWGNFSGSGIQQNNDNWFFNPMMAGPGTHEIAFEAVGCTDTFTIEVEPPADIPDYSFCELSAAEVLTADPPGGIWSGPGFLDSTSGLFDPQSLSPGQYEISYRAPSGCVTMDTVDIIVKEAVSITGVENRYCYSDTIIDVNVQPDGGTLYINGEVSAPSFNPVDLGTGTHELYYERGSGACASEDRIFFSVLPPITGETVPATDSICPGQTAVIEVEPQGGSGTLSANWDQGLGFGNSHIVEPQGNTWYEVTVTDGCSEPFTDSVFLFVYEPFDIDLEQGPEVCYGDSTWVEVFPPNDTDYSVHWQLDSVFEGNYLEGQPGFYELEVEEEFSGCSQEYEVEFPGADPISANFSFIPNQECIDIIENEIEIIDLGQGYTEARMHFGDGSPAIQMMPGESISHSYQNTGTYTITQVVQNELGCRDTFSRQLCVEHRVEMYVPNAFTPDGDETNDKFKIEAFGLADVEWYIYDRSGAKIFEARSLDRAWDGTFRGRKMNPGVFVVQVEYTNLKTGKRERYVGTVTLIR